MDFWTIVFDRDLNRASNSSFKAFVTLNTHSAIIEFRRECFDQVFVHRISARREALAHKQIFEVQVRRLVCSKTRLSWLVDH